jgi:hypothetical protein
MLEKYYWGSTKKAIIAFGNVFNNITLDRKNDAGGTIQTIRVPLAYAPRQKFIARIENVPEQDRNMEVSLPRMAFEILGFNYDESRKTNSINKTCTLVDQYNAIYQYSGVPYNLTVSLYIYAKNQDDGLQIVEQILPYFNPDYTLSMKAMPELGLIDDLPIILNNIGYDDQYEADFSARRGIFWTLTFTLKLNFYGPLHRQGVIRKATANVIISDGAIPNPGETISYVFTEADL